MFDLPSVIAEGVIDRADSVTAESRAGVASRWTKAPSEPPVNAMFSFNAAQLAFSPPTLGLREEQGVGYSGVDRTGSGCGEGRNWGGSGETSGAVSVISSFDANTGLASTSTSSSQPQLGRTSSLPSSHHTST